MSNEEAKRSPITGIQRVKVTSSNIAEIGHDPNTGVIEVKFKSGAVWQYPGGFHTEVFDAFKKAHSVGAFFRQHIYPRVNRQKHINVTQNEDETARQLGVDVDGRARDR